MMAKVKSGYMKCETRQCMNGNGGAGRVVVFVNEHGTLSYRCDECGATPYTRKGTVQHDAWLRDLEKVPGPAPVAPPKPAADPPPAPAVPAASRADW